MYARLNERAQSLCAMSDNVSHPALLFRAQRKRDYEKNKVIKENTALPRAQPVEVAGTAGTSCRVRRFLVQKASIYRGIDSADKFASLGCRRPETLRSSAVT